MQGTNFQAAMDKARVKRVVAEQLATLSREAQRDVLADLMLALDGDAQVPTKRHAETRTQPPTQSPKAKAAKRGPTGKGGGDGTSRGRPKGAVSAGAGRTDAVLAALREHPQMPIKDLAQIAYPGDDGGNHKVRAILWSLKKQGRAQNPSVGKWEATG